MVAFRLGLERYFNEVYDTTPALTLYDRLIRPLEPALEAAQIDTLVFIHDGFLRSVPMAALYDGQQFLIEKYAIATTPALTLTAPAAQRLAAPQALVLGSSQAVTVEGIMFTPLPAVPREVEAVVATLPGSQFYLDEAFSQGQLQQALAARNYPILHFATHGQFSPDPANTFIVTGKGEKVTFGQLETFVRSGTEDNEKIDLVVLTACETATGDDRATLGLAGVAIRAGARSAIATLWRVDDPVTAQLTQDFYRYLQDPSLNKAQALQKAQVAALRQGDASPPANGHLFCWWATGFRQLARTADQHHRRSRTHRVEVAFHRGRFGGIAKVVGGCRAVSTIRCQRSDRDRLGISNTRASQ